MGETNMKPANIVSDAMRNFCAWILDTPAYWLLGIMYQLFFNVASADLFSNGTILEFYKRIQLILGVFMMFQLAMTIIKGIMNPDSFTDSKSGAGSLIKRVAISLILLSVLVPINIPNARNEWETQLNNHGLLFGAMYSLQNRILSNNTLGRLILGTDENAESFTESDLDDEDSTLAKSSRTFTSAIIKGFYRINLLPEEQRTKHEPGKEDAVFNDNRVCKDMDDAVLKAYTRLDAKTSEIIDMVDLTCEYPEDADTDFLTAALSVINPQWNGKKRYVFAYTPVISAVVAFVFAFILLSFTIDVAVRAVKLAVLRLIAPIPIISYMDPKGGKDAAFNSWVKSLTSTYLDLFIRLAVVYFVIFLIQDMIVNGIEINKGSGVIGLLSMILIWIGLFVFAKQAPKFIKTALGMKDDGGKIFSGFGSLTGAAAVGAGAAGGVVSRGIASMEKHHNVGRALLAGFAGGVGGGVNAGKSFFTNKDANWASVMKSNRAYNARNYSNAADESSFFGRSLAGVQGTFGVRTKAEKLDNKIKDYKAANSAWKRAATALTSDGNASNIAYNSSQYDTGGAFTDGVSYSAKDANDIVGRMKSSGQYNANQIKAAEEYSKAVQIDRFDTIRKTDKNLAKNFKGTEAQIYQAAESIFYVGKKYADEDDEVFVHYKGVDEMKDASLKMGRDFKGASFDADREADAIKNSIVYAQAQANAKRADDKKK